MDPFSRIPVEARQVILEQQLNLRDLQAAILASRPLYLAYGNSRKLIRQRVFRVQILCGYLPANNDAAIFTRALRQIEILEKKNSNDGIILRESLWPLLITMNPERKFLEILVTWSLNYAKAYRASSREKEARHIEVQVVQLFYLHRAPIESGTIFGSHEGHLIVNWIRTTMTTAVQHQHYAYGAVLYSQICDSWDLMCHQTLPDLLTVPLSLCSNDGNSFVAKNFLGTVISRSWSLFWHSRSTSRHAGDMLCYHCLGGAKGLLAATRLAHVSAEETLSSIEKIWNEMSPRSPAASFWANLVVESHQSLGAGRLEGVLKIWNRLREIIPSDPTEFEIIDLDWARKVILELRNLERGRTQDRSLEFQASVLALLSRGSPVYYAFARNLADTYVLNGDTKSALTLRQQIWQDLQPTSRIYTSWARELAGLYRRFGREEEAIQLTRGMEERRVGNVNITV
ncbi:uncharacterized protein BHQ10_006041 [Talaromyces amestolkiae]|uniref:Uncharacterized protein n=1 Tax=Talaromyces amestolkiae TaxID=1196081 RepID=A0A364L2J2_TALAM|nr:uncharacterized protein BHQ10_006041 [Talaromyces amestolkiae]RAO70029.1 hypothetical protein BHQ10_006041 [Talaromyces amestolkiae]